VENYIDLKFLAATQVGGSGLVCPLNPMINPAFFCFQYQNIPHALLRGLEFESVYDAGSWFAGLSGTLFQKGRNLTEDLPLATVPPDWITATLGARFLDRKLTVLMRWQHVYAKDPKDVPPGAEAPPGATQGPPFFFYPTPVFDLVGAYVGYQIDPDTLASVSVDNLFDEQYARYMNVRPSGRNGINSTPLPFYSPGLTIKGSLLVRFSDKTAIPTKVADMFVK
jgi:hemoglobin/transferrin/lactoferrin receptor protein